MSNYSESNVNISELKNIQVEEELRDFLPSFLVRRFYDLDQLKKLVQEKDLVEADRLAHKLKGNGAAYGFQEITDIAVQIRKHIESGDHTGLSKCLTELEEYLNRFRQG